MSQSLLSKTRSGLRGFRKRSTEDEERRCAAVRFPVGRDGAYAEVAVRPHSCVWHNDPDDPDGQVLVSAEHDVRLFTSDGVMIGDPRTFNWTNAARGDRLGSTARSEQARTAGRADALLAQLTRDAASAMRSRSRAETFRAEATSFWEGALERSRAAGDS